MSEQVKTTETASAGRNTFSTFTTLPKDVHRQLPRFLTSYETITGLSASASWLRKLCLPLVEEVHIVVPSLREAFETAQAERNDEAGFACLPRDDEAWTRWTKEQITKLATGLLAQLPNLRHLYGYLSNPHYHFILGEALCQLEGPPLGIEELVWNGPENEEEQDFLRHAWTPTLTQEDLSPLAAAMGLGKLPALKSLNSSALRFNEASLMAVAEAISESQLLNLANLVIDVDAVDEQLEVLCAFASAYKTSVKTGEKKRNPQQVNMQVLDIRGADEDDGVQEPVALLLKEGSFEGLVQLHLGKGATDQSTLLSVGLYYLSNDGAPKSKRLFLRELSLPFMEDVNHDLMHDLVQALTVHQVAPNLASLSFYGTAPSVIPMIASIYQGGGLQHFQKLDLGLVSDSSPMSDFLHGVAQSTNKGGALELLMGEAMIEEYVVGAFEAQLSQGLRTGAFPRLRKLLFTTVFYDEDDSQLLVDALIQEPRPPFLDTLRCICNSHINPTQEAALRGLLGGEELNIVNEATVYKMPCWG
jgi:hypothetical protein